MEAFMNALAITLGIFILWIFVWACATTVDNKPSVIAECPNCGQCVECESAVTKCREAAIDAAGENK